MDSLETNHRVTVDAEELPTDRHVPNLTNVIESSNSTVEPSSHDIQHPMVTMVSKTVIQNDEPISENEATPPQNVDVHGEAISENETPNAEEFPTVSSDSQISPKQKEMSSENGDMWEDKDDGDENHSGKKQKQLSSFTTPPPPPPPPQPTSQNSLLQNQPSLENTNGIGNINDSATKITPTTTASKKSKKKNNNVWVTKTTRKGKKKTKSNTQTPVSIEEKVLITPVPRFSDKGDDTPEMNISLSKVYKAEKVELSEDRLTAGSSKGYRMVRTTRGVLEGAWYFEIKVMKMGETGHTRLGWCTDKGDLQAPVGYDGHSFGYRDIDGSKVNKALREKYGEKGYKEGDIIGFYINLPDGRLYTPKPPRLVWFKGQKYICAPDAKEDPPKVVPGSEISFFKNGVCQGVAFKDLYGGRYYPAASMYTLPNQPNCIVKFNFGPDFECFPEEFGGRTVPCAMVEVPYHKIESPVENGVSTNTDQ